MPRFRTYVLNVGPDVEFEVQKKLRTDVRGHYTYMLQGLTDNGIKANAVVNRSQWDRFDVPSEERSVGRKLSGRRDTELGNRLSRKREKGVPAKSRRRVVNEEIERWIAEHNGIDFDRLDGLE